MVVIGLGKNLLLKFVLGHCVLLVGYGHKKNVNSRWYDVSYLILLSRGPSEPLENRYMHLLIRTVGRSENSEGGRGGSINVVPLYLK